MTEDLLLVPGLNCTGALFSAQIKALTGAVRCHVADHGGAPTMQAIATGILAAAPARFALAGLSMGGYVAFEIIRQAPERVTRLCLMDTRAVMDTPEEADARRRGIALAEGGQFTKLHDILWPRLVHPSRQSDRALESVVLAMMRDTGAERFIRQQYAILNRSDYSEVVKGIRVPATIIVGDSDVITPPETSRAMQRLMLGSSLHVVAECGHLSTLERPDAVNRLLLGWLEI